MGEKVPFVENEQKPLYLLTAVQQILLLLSMKQSMN